MGASSGFVAGTAPVGGTTEALGRSNAAAILSRVLIDGPLARAEVADRVGLTRATVTRATTQLIELGLLSEGAPRRDNPGRPLVPLSVSGGDRAVVSLHFGALESRVGLVDLQGTVLVEERDAYATAEPDGIVDGVAARVRQVVEEHGPGRRLLGVGASVGGWVHPDSGVVVRFDPLGWRDVPLAQLVAERTGMPVHFDQFARGLALAERMYGTARGLEDFLLVWVGSIVDAALVQEGAVRRGGDGAAGTIVHFPVREPGSAVCECGRRGCLAHQVRDQALVAEAVRQGLVPPSTTIRELVGMADGPSGGVPELVDAAADTLAEAAAAMADLTNPDAVLVAGLVTTSSRYRDAFLRTFRERSSVAEKADVRYSGFGDLAPSIASAAVLLGRYFADPLGFERADRTAVLP